MVQEYDNWYVRLSVFVWYNWLIDTSERDGRGDVRGTAARTVEFLHGKKP